MAVVGRSRREDTPLYRCCSYRSRAALRTPLAVYPSLPFLTPTLWLILPIQQSPRHPRRLRPAQSRPDPHCVPQFQRQRRPQLSQRTERSWSAEDDPVAYPPAVLADACGLHPEWPKLGIKQQQQEGRCCAVLGGTPTQTGSKDSGVGYWRDHRWVRCIPITWNHGLQIQ
jgi:hypothetical protein